MDKETALKTILGFLIDAVPLEKLPNADAIFVFGHIDPRVAEQAARVYGLGKAPKIIVSGKGRKEIPGHKNEAQFYANILKRAGVPESALILEEEAMNSLENVILGMDACHKKGFYPKSLILVAMPPLLRRSRAVFKKHFPEIAVCGSAFDMSFSEYQTFIKRLIEEFDRFVPYAEKGDIQAIEIPEQVAAALAFLKQLPPDDTGYSHFYPAQNYANN
jgi:uncharacterized SAM-binding protein YcdF (DUF218 family)